MGKVTRKRHVAKTITWRIVASTTTFILAYLFFKEDPNAATKATGIAIAESALKMILYYFHERFWYKSKFGVIDKTKAEDE